MSKINSIHEDSWPVGFDQHRARQIIDWATKTTPETRLAMVEEMLKFVEEAGFSYHAQKELVSGVINSKSKQS